MAFFVFQVCSLEKGAKTVFMVIDYGILRS